MIEYIRTLVAPAFRLAGPVIAIAPLGEGLINPTFRVRTRGTNGRVGRYVIQAINHQVFPRPDSLMANLTRVLTHLARKMGPEGADPRRVLSLIPTRDGDTTWTDSEGRSWRGFLFIEDSLTLQSVTDPKLAYEAGRAFGHFVHQLADLPPPRLHEHLPGFHDTPARLRALRECAEANPMGRAGKAAPELDRIFAREDTVTLLARAQAEGTLPERPVHNDTKINNLLFDHRADQALCVIDLDTVMPGLALHDFGDLVRSAAASRPEGSGSGRLRLSLFEGLLRGWVTGMGPLLTQGEAELLAAAPRVITLELTMRFLTDHLAGDHYFKTDRPGQNLDRCRTQLGLLDSMEEQADAMERLVRETVRDRLRQGLCVPQ